MMMTLRTNRLNAAAVEKNAAPSWTAPAPTWPPYDPARSAASGRNALTFPIAQRCQAAHSPRPNQWSGVHADLPMGITLQPSCLAIARIAGIHICACESPITTSVRFADEAPRVQMRLDVSPSLALHPGGY